VAVDDAAVEVRVGDGRHHAVVPGPRRLLRETDAGVLGVGEAAVGTISWLCALSAPSTACSAARLPS
jgi:hypothetical protein